MKNIQAFSALILGALVLSNLKGSTPRGIRNNNPLNIRFNAANDWQGQIGSDGAFVIFDDHINGIRAAAKLIMNYGRFYGARTIESIISRWAPPNENDTGAYINHVASKLGVSPGAIIEDSQYPELLAAMTQLENGVQPYLMSDFAEGVKRAYG